MSRVGHLILRTLAIRASDPQNALTRTTLLSPTFPRIKGSFWDFFILFLVDNSRNSGNIFPHFCRNQFTPVLNLPGEHALIRALGKNWKTICSQHRRARGRPRIVTLMKSSIQRPWTPRKHNGGTFFIFQIVFLLLNLREIPAVCE